MELLERYVREIAEDLKIDEFNIKDVQMRLPSRKHFWVARLINHKIELERLKMQKDRRRKTMMQQLADNAPVKMSTATLGQSIDSTDDIVDLNHKIRENELIIELLEKTERNFSSCTYDIGNIIKIIQLEQQ